MQITEIQRNIIRALDYDPPAAAATEAMRDQDAVGLSVELNEMHRLGLLETLDGITFPTPDGVRAAWADWTP